LSRAAWAGSLVLVLLAGKTAAADIELRPGIAVHLAADEPEALRRAVADLRRDLQQAFGVESPLVEGLPASGAELTIVVRGPAAAREVGAGGAGGEVELEGVEAHRVSVQAGPGGGAMLVTEGSDLRGAIYAVYTLSEEVLGVPPMWVWASWQPELRRAITIARDLDLRHPAPTVRWRGWFPNDQDYLEPWKRRDPLHRELLAETLLRLKLNCWDTGSVLHTSLRRLTDDAQVAARRGLVVMSTHTSPLGARLDAGRWETYWKTIRQEAVPALADGRAEDLRAYWTHVIDAVVATGVETIWTLTFRADRDLPFWTLYGNAPETDEERAALIARFIRLQQELVEQRVGPEAWMRVPLYNEMSDYALAGHLDLPAGPRIIWNFVAARRDHYPPLGLEHVALPEDQPIGLYYNIQFTSTGSHVVAGEGPWKMEDNLRFVDRLQARPLALALVNSGNTREFVLELEASARLMATPSTYDSDRFLLGFAQRYFGAEHAPAVAGLIRAYFAAYWQQHPPTRPGFARQFIFHDLRHTRALRDLLAVLEKRGQTTEPLAQPDSFMIDPAHHGADSTLAALLIGTAAAREAFAEVAARSDALRAELPASRQVFFNDSVRVPAHYLVELNASLHALARAVAAAPNSRQRSEAISQAHAAFVRAKARLAETEHGRFAPWYPRADERDIAHLNSIELRLGRLAQPRR